MNAIKDNKKIILDVILNITASALPIAMLQLVIYPFVAKKIGGDEYGLMLTIYSVWIMISNSLGNVLNNIKLLRFPEYKEKEYEGDIPILLRQWTIVNSIVIFIVIWLYCGNFSLIHLFAGVAVATCILLKSYLEVGFRIELNYINILLNNFWLSLGFFIGFLIFWITDVWELIFLIGYATSCVFCIKKTNLIREPSNKTPIFQEVKKDSYSLVLSAIITNLINYADKLVLYPLMGGTTVAIYYTATILGKITGMLTGPINSVILSYITRWDKSKANFFYRVIAIGAVIIIVGYFVTLIIAKPIIGLLFPQWLEEVLEILPLTTATIMLNVLASILQPFVLKYCKIQWQIMISGIGSATYFICALFLWLFMGLKGFCIGTIIGVITKLILMITVYYRAS